MMSREDGELLTHVGRGTAMGALVRRYWTRRARLRLRPISSGLVPESHVFVSKRPQDCNGHAGTSIA